MDAQGDADPFAPRAIAIIDKHGILKADLCADDQNEEVAASLYTLAIFLGHCLGGKRTEQRLFSARAIATKHNCIVHVSGGGVAYASPLASPINSAGIELS